MGSIGDFLESGPEDSLEHHLPKLVFEEFSVLEKDIEEAFNSRLLHTGPTVSANREDNAEQRQENSLPEIDIDSLVLRRVWTML